MTVVASDVTRDTSHELAAAADACAEWQLWLLIERKAPVTREDYLRTVAALLRKHPTVEFEAFTPAQLMEHILAYPTASQRVKRAHLTSWFAWGEATGRIELGRSPMNRVPKIKRTPQKIIETFTDAERALLMGPPLVDGALFTIMLETGIRKTECRLLQRKHINLDRLQVVVAKGKGDKGRIIPIDEESPLVGAIADLDLFERIQPDEYLWYARWGAGKKMDRSRPIGDGTFHRWYERAIRAAGVAYVPRSADNEGIHNPHTTRHTFITRCLQRGIPLEVVSKWAGHASVSTTADIYCHVTTDDTRRYLELLRD